MEDDVMEIPGVVKFEDPSNDIDTNEKTKLAVEELKANIKSIADKFKSYSTEDQEKFKLKMKEAFSQAMKKKVLQNITQKITDNYLLVVFVIILLVLILAFFGYKLYKSLTERERKREEKAKTKMAKKKK